MSVYPPGVHIGYKAALSPDGAYRYVLVRRWGAGQAMTFIMLNPSTADAEVDDPTIRRCVSFARIAGAGAIHVLNLYAYRATRPADLWKAADPIGPDNDRTLAAHARSCADQDRPIVAAWGALARADRVKTVLAMPGMDRLTALGPPTKTGAPRHPLYLPSTARLAPWEPKQ